MPVVVLLMILYYGIFGSVDISEILVAVIGFSINFAAYSSGHPLYAPFITFRQNFPFCKGKECRHHIGNGKIDYCRFNLFAHKTIIENIMMGQVDLLGRSRQEAYDRGMELLRTIGLANFIS